MTDNFNKQLEDAVKEYDKICEKLQYLNNHAFELEQHIAWLKVKVKQND